MKILEQQYKKSFLIELLYILSIGAIIYVLGRFFLGYLFPFIIAIIVAFFSQKIALKISKRLKVPFGFCAAFTAAAIFITVAAVIIGAIYLLLRSAGSVIGDFSSFTGFVKNIIGNIENSFSKLLKEISPEVSNLLGSLVGDMVLEFKEKITIAVSDFAARTAKGTPSFLFSSIVALVASCYIAKDYNVLLKFFKGLFPNRVFDKLLKIKVIITHSIYRILKGYFILMIITFVELLLGFFVLQIGYAPILAFAIAIIDLLPVFGTGTVLIPWGVAEIISGNSKIGFGVIILYIIITLVRNFAEPKIIGKQIGINPLFTLIAMFAGLKLFGFWGLITFPVALIVIIKYYKNEMVEEAGN